MNSAGIRFLGAVFIGLAYGATSQVTITGEIRPRSEYRHGYKSLIDPAQTGSVFTEQRTRLTGLYSTDKYKIGLAVQDVRVWGGQPAANKSDGLLSVHEAWGEYFFSRTISVKMGRQELSYDDERIFGTVDWVQQARSHDLAVFKLTDSTFTAHAGWAYNQNAESNTGLPFTVVNQYKQMHFVWLNKVIRNLKVSLLVVNSGIQSPVSVHSTRFSQTLGPHLVFAQGHYFLSLRGYYQTGTDGASNKDIAAYFAGADFGVTMPSGLTVGIGGECISGQSQTNTSQSYKEVNHAFNPLYGTAHKFNGYMDYFYAGNHVNTVGLTDLYFKIKYKMEKGWVGADIHQFIAAADVLDSGIFNQQGKYIAMSPHLGTELDLTYALSLSKGVAFQAGYSQIFATKTLETLKGGKKDTTNNWAYVMFAFRPQFTGK